MQTENRATSYGLVDGKIVAVESEDRDEVIAPAGSIRSCTKDMAEWMLACLGDGQNGTRLLRPDILREMQSLQMSIPVMGKRGKNVYVARFYGSGLGWTVLDYRGRKFCDHAGSAGTMVAIMPEERIGVVVLTNVGWSNLSGMLMYDVFDAYLLGPENAYGDLIVSHEEGKLLFTFGMNKPAAATHWEHETIYVERPVASDPDVDWLASFNVGDGTVRSLSIHRLGWHESMPIFKRGEKK